MKILDAVAEKTILGTLVLVLKELRRLTTAIETGVDSFRQVHGHQPVFHVPQPAAPPDPDAGRTVPHASESDEPDYLRLDILESLCREHHLAVDGSTDLIAIGKEMGWLDERGNVVALPTNYGQ